MRKFKTAEKCYILESNMRVKAGTVIRQQGHFYIIQIEGSNGAIRLSESRLFKSEEEAETGNNTYNELENYCQCNGGKRLAGHDIKAMIKEVNPRNEYILKNIRLKNSGGSVPPSRYNELWRYGAEVEDLDQEETTEKTLIRIAEWIKTRI